jgi:hypothetical protein
MCASDVAVEKLRFNRGFKQPELLAKRLGVPPSGHTFAEKAAAAGQTPTNLQSKVGGGLWRFCHTSGQPS